MRKGTMLPTDLMPAFLPKLQELTAAHTCFLAAPDGSEERRRQSARQEAAVKSMNSDELRAVSGFANSLEWLVTEKKAPGAP